MRISARPVSRCLARARVMWGRKGFSSHGIPHAQAARLPAWRRAEIAPSASHRPRASTLGRRGPEKMTAGARVSTTGLQRANWWWASALSTARRWAGTEPRNSKVRWRVSGEVHEIPRLSLSRP